MWLQSQTGAGSNKPAVSHNPLVQVMRADTFDKQIGLRAYILHHRRRKIENRNHLKVPFKVYVFGWMDVPLTPGRFHSTNPGGGFLKYSEELVAGNSGSSNSFFSLMQSFFSSLYCWFLYGTAEENIVQTLKAHSSRLVTGVRSVC